jgi:hypothetical protein
VVQEDPRQGALLRRMGRPSGSVRQLPASRRRPARRPPTPTDCIR